MTAVATTSLGAPWLVSTTRVSRQRCKQPCFRAAAAEKEPRPASKESDELSPDQYPTKDLMAGGWAGGEVGLQEFLQNQPAPQEPAVAKPEPESSSPSSSGSIEDDPRKYPAKEVVAGIPGMTGGFAGGERGVQAFVEEGDIKLAPPSGRREYSPLIVAGIAAVAGTLGGLLLFNVEREGEILEKEGEAAIQTALAAPIDNGTKTLLQLAVGLLFVTALAAGLRAAAKKGQQSS